MGGHRGTTLCADKRFEYLNGFLAYVSRIVFQSDQEGWDKDGVTYSWRFPITGKEDALSERSGGANGEANDEADSEYRPPRAEVEVCDRKKDKTTEEVEGAREVIVDDVTVKKLCARPERNVARIEEEVHRQASTLCASPGRVYGRSTGVLRTGCYRYILWDKGFEARWRKVRRGQVELRRLR